MLWGGGGWRGSSEKEIPRGLPDLSVQRLVTADWRLCDDTDHWASGITRYPRFMNTAIAGESGRAHLHRFVDEPFPARVCPGAGRAAAILGRFDDRKWCCWLTLLLSVVPAALRVAPVLLSACAARAVSLTQRPFPTIVATGIAGVMAGPWLAGDLPQT